MAIHQMTNDPKVNRILQDLIDVIRINIFVVNPQGLPVLMPSPDYGWDLLAEAWSKKDILKKFKTEGAYLKYEDPFHTTTFALPVNPEHADGGYVMVGPVILSKKLERPAYEEIARTLNVAPEPILKIIEDIRAISFNSLQSILGLVTGISGFIFAQRDFYAALLDMALNIAQAECGSIMVLNKDAGELTIQVSRGLSADQMALTPIKVGEGIAGLAAKQNKSFVINDSHPDNRIKGLLKRPEIKQSIILPLVSGSEHVVGVLNVSTRRENSRLASSSPEILKSLSQFALVTIGSAPFLLR